MSKKSLLKTKNWLVRNIANETARIENSLKEEEFRNFMYNNKGTSLEESYDGVKMFSLSCI